MFKFRPNLLYNYNSVSVCPSIHPTTVPHFNWRGGTGPGSLIPRPGTGPDSRIPKTGTGPDWERAARQGRAGQGGRGRAGSGRGRGPGRVGQGVRENGRPDRAGPGRGAGGRAGAPTGDFTLAFGHGHPLVPYNWNLWVCVLATHRFPHCY
jgi:hypothetical protein